MVVQWPIFVTSAHSTAAGNSKDHQTVEMAGNGHEKVKS
jgi:hypothetical protein